MLIFHGNLLLQVLMRMLACMNSFASFQVGGFQIGFHSKIEMFSNGFRLVIKRISVGFQTSLVASSGFVLKLKVRPKDSKGFHRACFAPG